MIQPRPLIFVLLALTVLGFGKAQAAPSETEPSKMEWSDEFLDLAASLPVQDGGRIKPLDTYARFLLLRINGKRTFEVTEDEKISALEWLLDTLFYPEIATNYEVFLIQADDVLDAMGLEHEGKKKRDRYSYAHLEPGRDKLFELASKYAKIDAKDQSVVQGQIVNLAHNMSEFERVMLFFQFARVDYEKNGIQAFNDVEGAVYIVDVLNRNDELWGRFRGTHDEAEDPEMNSLRALMSQIEFAAGSSSALALFPPPAESESKEWLTPGDITSQRIIYNDPLEKQVALLGDLDRVVRARGDSAEMEKSLAAFHAGVKSLAEQRGEYGKIGLEVTYYRSNLLLYSLVFFLLGFVMVAVSWMRPQQGLLDRFARWYMMLPLALLTAAITMRCIIRDRPPVSTLYETILFITACIGIVCLAIEFINRQKAGVSLAAILGAAGIFLANKYEVKEGVDTMPSLVAVLDTNFWLSTHVTTVTLGYAAGLLACAIANVYLLAKVLRIKRNRPEFFRNLARMAYGVLCFGLLFSIVGTILGGIWANDSWGRFWGWDPKENGALMIVLFELAILHARLGGYIRDFGLCMASAFGGIIVVFSWWGVNLLGVGLHSYGFTQGVALATYIYYGIQGIVLLLGGAAWLGDRGGPAPPTKSSGEGARAESSAEEAVVEASAS